MRYMKFLRISCALGLGFAAGTASATLTNAAPRQVMVSPDFPLASNQLPLPAFSSANPGSTSVQTFDRGNWHYEIHYGYSQTQGEQVTEYEARRIHASQSTPVPESSLSNPDCIIINPKIATGPTPDCAGTRGAPPPGNFDPPSSQGTEPGQQSTDHYPNYPYDGSTWDVTIVWEWVVGPNGEGQWEQVEVIEKRNN